MFTNLVKYIKFILNTFFSLLFNLIEIFFVITFYYEMILDL